MIDIKNIQPVGKRVLVKTFDGPQVSKSGLIMPDKELASIPVMAEVIAHGADSQFKTGQTVMFRKYSLDELKFMTAEGEVKLNLLEDEEIVAVLLANE